MRQRSHAYANSATRRAGARRVAAIRGQPLGHDAARRRRAAARHGARRPRRHADEGRPYPSARRRRGHATHLYGAVFERRSQASRSHWARWVDMRARDLVRRRSSEEPVVMAPSLHSNDVPLSYDHVPCGDKLDPIRDMQRGRRRAGVVSAATNRAHRNAIRETWQART